MKDSRNLTIGLLSITAIVLVGLLVLTMSSSNAYAYASARQGDYIMVNASLSGINDMIFIVDVPTRRVNVYSVNVQKNSLELLDSADLKKIFP